MIRDITIGQFYPVDSFIHKLDPRTKIIASFIYITSLFLVDSIDGYTIVVLFLLMLINTAKVPLSFMMRGLRPVFLIIFLTVTLNIFFTPGETIILNFGRLTVTKEGINLAIYMALRFVFLIVGSSLLTLTTSPMSLTDGIEQLLMPLSKFKVPAHEIAMMMTIALRFIPILLEETDKIMKAQMARGADFESGNLVKKAKSLIPIFIPLFISAFKRATDLAFAMEARCYKGGEGRTKMKQLRYQKRDLAAFLFVIGYVVAIVMYNIIK